MSNNSLSLSQSHTHTNTVMELTSYNTFISGLLLLCKIIYWDIRHGNFLPEPFTFLQPFADFVSTIWNHHFNNNKKSAKTESSESQQSSIFSQDTDNYQHHDLGIGEIKMVMNKLGLQLSDDNIVQNEIASLFDQEEPSLDEVKEAFDVFDENRDGFIDVVELHRVLCNLGQKQGAGLDDCKRMISGFDENGDGVVDFKEFIRLLEISFC